MSSADTTQSTDFQSPTNISRENETVLKTLTQELDNNPDQLEIFECQTTGELYAAVQSGYKKVTVTNTGLEVETITTLTPDVELDPLTRIEPDAGETIHDAVDNLSFSGD